MTERLFVVVPPSQSKAVSGRAVRRRGVFDEILDQPRREVLDALTRVLTSASSGECERLFGARGDLLVRALDATKKLTSGEAPRVVAWHRYQGVVWKHLDPQSLSPSVRKRLLVPSGLYGLLGGEDPIADYRLTMNVGLAPLGSLARYWRSTLTSVLGEYTKNSTVVNFLPLEYARSVDFDSLPPDVEVIHVHFVTRDEKRAVGHDAKAVKGVLVRGVLLDGQRALFLKNWQGWRVRREENEVYVVAPKIS